MNPILPLKYYVPDVEARVWKDGKIYLYGSWDIQANMEYCSREYHVMYSKGFQEWKKSETSISNINGEISWGEGLLFAPDCIEKDDEYYLYFCLSDGSEGVAKSSNPCGPFENPVPVQGANGLGIDPAVFMDEDGKFYYYWGQFELMGAQLDENMKTLKKSTITKQLITEKAHGFHEGASMRKRNGIYYLVYTDISRGKATCLSYAMSSSPLGPFKKGGIIIDNTGCDPNTWNNHGSIQEINGQWYVFYHRSTHASKYSRRVCVEPIYFDNEGHIREVEMTTQGADSFVSAKTSIEAARASRLNGTVYIDSELINGEEFLNGIETHDWAEYKYLNFEGETNFQIKVLCKGYGGDVLIRLDSPMGKEIGKVKVGHQAKWTVIETEIEEIYGIHALYLVFNGKEGNLFNIKEFKFTK